MNLMKVGDKVVFVDWQALLRPDWDTKWWQKPECGKVYTVREIREPHPMDVCQEIGVLVEEIVNPLHPIAKLEHGYGIGMWRPVKFLEQFEEDKIHEDA